MNEPTDEQAATSYIGPKAYVGGLARVTGSARVTGLARVTGSAWVGGSAYVGDSAWVGGLARVTGSAYVGGSAQVGGDGIINKTSDYVCVGPALSSARWTTAHRDRKIGVRVNCGCFSGTVAEFESAIEQTHAKNAPALAQYRAFVALIKAHFAAADMMEQS